MQNYKIFFSFNLTLLSVLIKYLHIDANQVFIMKTILFYLRLKKEVLKVTYLFKKIKFINNFTITKAIYLTIIKD